MRRSLFGPMLLIAAGGLLLARNFNVDFPLGELFAQHWPWILIVWGGFRFLEAATAAVRNRRGPRALGVGAVLFACLICILGSAARSRGEGRWSFPSFPAGVVRLFGEDYVYDVDDVDLSPPADADAPLKITALEITNLRGRVRVVGDAGVEEIRVSGSKRIRALSRSDAERLAARAKPSLAAQRGELVLSGPAISARESGRVWFDIEVRVPRAAELRLDSRRAEFEVTGLAAPLRVDAARAVRLRKLAGPVTVAAPSLSLLDGEDLGGDVDVEGDVRSLALRRVAGRFRLSGQGRGSVRLERVEGAVAISSSSGKICSASLPGRLEIVNRSLTLERARGPVEIVASHWNRIKVQGVSGVLTLSARRADLVLELPGAGPREGEASGAVAGAVDIQLERGDIELLVARDGAFGLDASTEAGEIRIRGNGDFEKRFTHVRAGRSETLRAAPLGGAPLLKLATGRGDITLRAAQQNSARL